MVALPDEMGDLYNHTAKKTDGKEKLFHCPSCFVFRIAVVEHTVRHKQTVGLMGGVTTGCHVCVNRCRCRSSLARVRFNVNHYFVLLAC